MIARSKGDGQAMTEEEIQEMVKEKLEVQANRPDEMGYSSDEAGPAKPAAKRKVSELRHHFGGFLGVLPAGLSAPYRPPPTL